MGIEYPRCRYRVDADDQIDWVDEYWLAFAAENGATELDQSAVRGRKLWDFIGGDVTREVYSRLHDRVRSSGRTAVLPFRCDSPSIRRHMRLTVSCGPSGTLLYDSLLVRAEPRRWIGLIDPRRPRSDDVMEMCSFCKRAFVQPLGWLDLEDAYVSLRLFEVQHAPELRYVVCPRCEGTTHEACALVDASFN